MVNSVEAQLTPTSCAVGSLASAQQRDVLAAHDRSSKLGPITHNTWQRIRWLTRARAVCPASAERVRPAADVSGNWTNVAMGPWLTKRSSVASHCPAANRSVSADIVAAALQARHICSRRHAGQTVPLRAQNGSSARRLDRASESADPMTFHSLRGRPSKPAHQ